MDVYQILTATQLGHEISVVIPWAKFSDDVRYETMQEGHFGSVSGYEGTIATYMEEAWFRRLPGPHDLDQILCSFTETEDLEVSGVEDFAWSGWNP